MKEYRASIRYAQALLASAEKGDLLERIEKELAEAAALVGRYPEILHLLMNATISVEEKEDFIGKILPPGFSNLTVNFLKVLIKKRRFQDLPLIQERFHRLYEEKNGIQRVRVHSPIPLDEALRGNLKQALEKKLRKKVYLETAIDPEVLGGLILDFEGTRLDASFRSKLYELRQRLLNPHVETRRSH